MYPGYKFEFGPRGNGICHKMSRNLSENGRIQKCEHQILIWQLKEKQQQKK